MTHTRHIIGYPGDGLYRVVESLVTEGRSPMGLIELGVFAGGSGVLLGAIGYFIKVVNRL